MKTRYYCRNKEGKDLFYVELLDEPFFRKMWLIFSFDANFLLSDDMKRLISCIEERVVKEPLREHFLERLFKLIQSVPNIDRLYFDESVLDRNGKLSESNYNAQQDIISDFFPEELQPVTQKDGIAFHSLAP